MIGLVVQLALLLQLFGGRRGDDVLNMRLMHTTLEQQPVDLDELNFVGPSPATILKFAMAMNKVSSACLVQGPHHGTVCILCLPPLLASSNRLTSPCVH